MSWGILGVLVVVLGVALVVIQARRMELVRMHANVEQRAQAVEAGQDKAQLKHPLVDLSRCLGCGTCVAACPEDGVLELVHGQAMVVRGARCKGISACERECPAGAIQISLVDADTREDIPVITEELEAVGSPGLFLAGEVTAHSLVKTAVDHGRAVAAEVARRCKGQAEQDSQQPAFDLVVVGAGPAGLACSLEAKRNGLNFVTLEREPDLGGTVTKYPRGKLVITEPVDLPLHGRMRRNSYSKEQLVELWAGLAKEHELPIHTGVTFEGLERNADGLFVVHTSTGDLAAHYVCLSLGRRGIPKRLNVPGEDLPKVHYQLLDASTQQGRRILVVGGGDSAVEAAMGLAEQAGNQVTLAHRREEFTRLRARNEQRLLEQEESGKLSILRSCEVVSITAHNVELALVKGPSIERRSLPNDDVYVMAGGTPPFATLAAAGVSFDPSLRPKSDPGAERGTGLLLALSAGFGTALLALVFALYHRDYYLLSALERPTHSKHLWLRPSWGLGLGFALVSMVMIGLNLVYLLRRSTRFKLEWGTLEHWMTSHVATGVVAFLCAFLHAGMSAKDSPGGHALWALFALLVTGGIGRYLYAWVPRAANGRELELDELRSRLQSTTAERGGFGLRARQAVLELVEARQWSGNFLGRCMALAGVRGDLRRLQRTLKADGLREGVPLVDVQRTLRISRRAYRTALLTAHFEDLRGLLSTWRWLHRWVAALMVLLVALHVMQALIYGNYFDADFGGAPR